MLDNFALDNAVLQVADERHPEHIRGNGPEQDYLSRSLEATLEAMEQSPWERQREFMASAATKDILRASGLT